MNQFEDLLNRFSGLLDRFEGKGGAHAAPSSTSAPSASIKPESSSKRLHKVVKEFDNVMTDPLNLFIEQATKYENKKIGEASGYIKEMFLTIRNIIHAITLSKKSDSTKMGELISPIVKDLDKKIGKCSRDMNIK